MLHLTLILYIHLNKHSLFLSHQLTTERCGVDEGMYWR